MYQRRKPLQLYLILAFSWMLLPTVRADIDICNRGNTDLYYARLATGPFNLFKGRTQGKVDSFFRISPGTCKDVHWDLLETVAYAFFRNDKNGTWGNVVYDLSDSRSGRSILGELDWAPEYICIEPIEPMSVSVDRRTVLDRYTPPCRAPTIKARVSFAAKTRRTDRPLRFSLAPDENILLEPWGQESSSSEPKHKSLAELIDEAGAPPQSGQAKKQDTPVESNSAARGRLLAKRNATNNILPFGIPKEEAITELHRKYICDEGADGYAGVCTTEWQVVNAGYDPNGPHYKSKRRLEIMPEDVFGELAYEITLSDVNEDKDIGPALGFIARALLAGKYGDARFHLPPKLNPDVAENVKSIPLGRYTVHTEYSREYRELLVLVRQRKLFGRQSDCVYKTDDCYAFLPTGLSQVPGENGRMVYEFAPSAFPDTTLYERIKKCEAGSELDCRYLRVVKDKRIAKWEAAKAKEKVEALQEQLSQQRKAIRDRIKEAEAIAPRPD